MRAEVHQHPAKVCRPLCRYDPPSPILSRVLLYWFQSTIQHQLTGQLGHSRIHSYMSQKEPMNEMPQRIRDAKTLCRRTHFQLDYLRKLVSSVLATSAHALHSVDTTKLILPICITNWEKGILLLRSIGMEPSARKHSLRYQSKLLQASTRDILLLLSLQLWTNFQLAINLFNFLFLYFFR